MLHADAFVAEQDAARAHLPQECLVRDLVPARLVREPASEEVDHHAGMGVVLGQGQIVLRAEAPERARKQVAVERVERAAGRDAGVEAHPITVPDAVRVRAHRHALGSHADQEARQVRAALKAACRQQDGARPQLLGPAGTTDPGAAHDVPIDDQSLGRAAERDPAPLLDSLASRLEPSVDVDPVGDPEAHLSVPPFADLDAGRAHPLHRRVVSVDEHLAER